MRYGFLLGVAAVFLTGCATDTIRIDRATAVGTAGKSAVAGTKTILGEVDAANRDKLIAVAALDPACLLPNPTILGSSRSARQICLPAGQARRRDDYDLRRFDSRAFVPALATLEGLSAYLGAIDAILTRKRPDVGAELDGVIVKLSTVVGNAATLARVPAPELLTDEQREAATGALSLVSGIANEAQTVADLRRFETPERDVAFQETIARLRVVNTALADTLRTELDEQQLVFDWGRARFPNTPERRREEMGVIERMTQVSELQPKLNDALDALSQSRDGYLALLKDARAPLTRDEDVKRARRERERAIAALNAVARLVRVF